VAAISSYLAEGRLADVLALIQVLAYDRDTSRSEDGLRDELQRTPLSSPTWIELASQHPEFFRVRNEEGRKKRVALLARYVLEYQATPNGDDEKRPPLPPDIANKLMETAIDLHDRQLSRSERWKVIAALLVPMLVAVIAASAAITAAMITAARKPAADGPTQQIQPAKMPLEATGNKQAS